MIELVIDAREANLTPAMRVKRILPSGKSGWWALLYLRTMQVLCWKRHLPVGDRNRVCFLR